MEIHNWPNDLFIINHESIQRRLMIYIMEIIVHFIFHCINEMNFKRFDLYHVFWGDGDFTGEGGISKFQSGVV